MSLSGKNIKILLIYLAFCEINFSYCPIFSVWCFFNGVLFVFNKFYVNKTFDLLNSIVELHSFNQNVSTVFFSMIIVNLVLSFLEVKSGLFFTSIGWAIYASIIIIDSPRICFK